jgi:glycosyltransferase involved in cell wall biosynthesis
MQTDNPPSSTTEPLKFTIATVTYNATETIERTILSVEEQDYPYVEHLIIDGN